MAEGGMTLELNENLTDRLIAAAEKAGQPADEYAAQIIGEALDDEWFEAERRWAEYERTGESVSLADAMAGLRAGLKAHYDAKAWGSHRRIHKIDPSTFLRGGWHAPSCM